MKSLKKLLYYKMFSCNNPRVPLTKLLNFTILFVNKARLRAGDRVGFLLGSSGISAVQAVVAKVHIFI